MPFLARQNELSKSRRQRHADAARPLPPRERLLNSARRLFCKQGINATGVDAIVNDAGTAKTTLYKEFGSKSKLVRIVLETEGREWRTWFLGEVEAGGGDGRARLLCMFAVLRQWFVQDTFFGCPFINAIGEHDKDDKALRAITMKHKRVVLDYIEKQTRALGAEKPADLAHQIALLMDGAIVAAMVTGDARVANSAAIAAQALIDARDVKRLRLKSRSSRAMQRA